MPLVGRCADHRQSRADVDHGRAPHRGSRGIQIDPAGDRETIEVLHLIGAHDGFVTRACERNALWMGLHGGLIGLGLGALTFVVVGQVSAGLAAPLMPRFSLPPGGLLVLGSMPLVRAAIAMVTARFTVRRALADMP